jgi:hypothetical protein
MDVNKLSQGQLIAAGSAIVLFILTFLPWLDEGGQSASLWESTSTLDIYILILVALVAAPAVMGAMGNASPLPFTGAATTVLLGVIAVILIFVFLIGPVPSYGADVEFDQPGKGIGLWLGLLAAIGVAAGGYMALADEGERINR